MNEKQRMIFLGVILATAISYGVVSTIQRANREKKAKQEAAQAQAEFTEAVEAAQKESKKTRPKVDYLKEPQDPSTIHGWGRNPFREPNQADLARYGRQITKQVQPMAPSYVLGGVMVRGARKAAVINEKVMRVGEMIDGAEVVKIQHDRVLLKKGKKDIELTWEGA